jgi:hypothetical protein
MNGHHLILGQLNDYITGEQLADTHDERYRQDLCRLLVEKKGYARREILPRFKLRVSAGDKRAIVPIDLLIRLGDRIGMLVKYGPGSITTRHRPALAASRIVADYPVPVVVVTNGREADVLDGASGRHLSSGLRSIPARETLRRRMASGSFSPLNPSRLEWEARIVYAFEVDGGCPCDDTVCRLS